METSDLLNLITSPFKSLFLYHKKKLAFFLFAVLLFLLALFPYSDLTSFSKEKINQTMKSSGGSVDYSKINLNLLPFGIKTTDFEFLSRSLKKPLKVQSITLRPNILSLFKLQPGGTAVLNGLFSGSADFSFALNGKTEEKTQKFNLSSDLRNISIADLISFQNLPYKLTGSLNGDLFAEGEDSFRVQPKGEFKFNMRKVVIPSTISIPNVGDIPLPKKVTWQNSNLFGKIEKGKVTITEGTLGTKSAPINGRYKGFIKCSLNKSGTKVSQSCTDYDIRVELELNAEFQKKLAADLKPLINPRNVNIVSLPQGGAKYLFSVQGNASQRFRAPRFSSINVFE
ncbi:MAG: type II secretion system protein GspN [Bdellovibrionales bacterium]